MIINLELAKRYFPLVPEIPSDQACETSNPELAELFREIYNLTEKLPDQYSEAYVCQWMDREIFY